MGAPQYEQAGADIGGTGTTNTIPRWTGPSTLGDSGLIDDGTQVYTTTRNVGIGTASPGAKLDVSDTANQLRATVSNSTPAVTTYALGTREGYISARQENSGSFNVFTDVVSSTTQFTPSGIRFFTHASGDASISERARIDSAGNFGIGTANPSAPLTFGKAVYAAPTSEDFYRIKIEDFGGIANDVGFGSPASGSLGINWSSSGSLIFYQANAAVSERARFDSSGNFILNTANTGATIQAAGTSQGLKLPATPGNADAQTLDCYQENTGWVPTITFGGASTGMTYTTQAGSWTKIGNLVFVTGRIVLSAKGSSTGVARLANLPVAVGASNASGGGMVGPVANITFGGQLAIYAVASATTLGLAKNTSGGAAVDLTDADFTNTSDITFSCIYRV